MDIKSLTAIVQHNCDISDAHHAGDYTLCIYLLKMREFYRWQLGMDWSDIPEQGAVMDWVTAKESAWDALAEVDYQSLPLAGGSIDPFDEEAANTVLNPLGYLYTAGLGRFGKPIFLLARLKEQERTAGYLLRVAGEELARELAAPPAMARKGNIVVRHESLQQLVWGLVEEWRWHKPQNAMSRVVDHYGFDRDPQQALEQATLDQQELLILHEIGELTADEVLGGEWSRMLESMLCTGAELGVRAVRDHLADCLTLLPALLDERSEPSLHFYFANLAPLRKDLFPALVTAYNDWVAGGDLRGITSAVRRGQLHWSDCGQEMLALHRNQGAEACAGIEQLLGRSSL